MPNVTPPQSARADSNDTPIGDHNRKPKIQLCLELRNKEIPKSKRKKTQKLLEVTVMWVKHLPQTKDKSPNPFVKLRFQPSDLMFTTELKAEKSDAQYIEIFQFPLPVGTDSLEGSLLEIQVCDKKATRNCKSFGNVTLTLDGIQMGKPVIEWYNLNVVENEEQVAKKK